jgi:hypothetical protein
MNTDLLPEQEAFIIAYGRACACVLEETLREYFRLTNAGEYDCVAGLESVEHITDCWILYTDGVHYGRTN